MTWGFHKRSKFHMGNGRDQLAFLCFLLLLMLLLLEINPCFADESGKFSRGKKGNSPSGLNGVRVHRNGYKKSTDRPEKNVNGDEVFDEEKRRVYTGPNPLHNR